MLRGKASNKVIKRNNHAPLSIQRMIRIRTFQVHFYATIVYQMKIARKQNGKHIRSSKKVIFMFWLFIIRARALTIKKGEIEMEIECERANIRLFVQRFLHVMKHRKRQSQRDVSL